MKVHTLNQLAIWVPMKNDELDSKVQPTGYRYSVDQTIQQSTEEEPVIRYVKNYNRHNKDFSLCMITTSDDAEAIEAWMDSQADELEANDIIRNFIYTNRHYDG